MDADNPTLQELMDAGLAPRAVKVWEEMAKITPAEYESEMSAWLEAQTESACEAFREWRKRKT